MTGVEGLGLTVVPSTISPPHAHPQPLTSLPLSIPSTTTAMLPRMEKPVYSSPPPATSTPENNACRLIDYRGAKVAAFNVDGRELVCLPQAFELFLKHLVGGLHTVYTKLKRLDVIPIVCNVEQVRILRGLGAIQPGVNRCKLISPKEFDILYEDCTNSSARPGRPPKRGTMIPPSVEALEKLKKSRLDGSSDYPYPPTSLMDLKKSPLFGNGYQYPPHLAHIPFMPIGHPALMNFAMANHLGLRHQELLNMAERNQQATDLSSPSRLKEDRDDHLRSEHNNNNNKSGHADMDKPLNLEIHHRVSETQRHSANTDKDSVSSGHSDLMHNGQLDLTTKMSRDLLSRNDDMEDADDESDEDKEDDDDLDTTDMSTSGAPSGEVAEKSTNQSLPFSSQLLSTENSGISSVETLLMNIQGLLKVAAENARHREQQTNFEKAELKMEILREREMRENLEKQLVDEQKNKMMLQKRLKKEKRAKKRLQEQLDGSEGVGMHMPGLPAMHAHQGAEDHLKQTQDNLRMLNDSTSQDADVDRNNHSPMDGDRKLPDSRGSGIQNLMETFLSSAQKSSSSAATCNGAVGGYLHSPVIKQTETA